jgi:hypothetical protein
MAGDSRPSGLKVASAVLVGAGIAVLALVTAPAAALVSRMCLRPGVVTVPYGLVLSAAASLGVIILARAVSRFYSYVAAAAWLVGLGIVMKGTSGGGFLIANDALGWSFLILDTVVVLGGTLLGGSRR